MIHQLLIRSGVSCRGGFIAYYNEMSVYCPDPMAMFSRSIAVLVCGDGRLLICPVDLSRTAQEQIFLFKRIERAAFGSRSTGALFFRGCYFSIHEGPLTGRYQISEDYIACDEFPNPRAYRKFLLDKTQE